MSGDFLPSGLISVCRQAAETFRSHSDPALRPATSSNLAADRTFGEIEAQTDHMLPPHDFDYDSDSDWERLPVSRAAGYASEHSDN